ncbi:MAG TPA: TetR/AcrR family transcriptional regulator [Trebonia sp.]|jgi:AcrR family transcriptional regulator|nr:TetR/AcrR family transcriptional regulator [Trebonia sp.]
MVPVGREDTRVQQIAGPPAPETLRADQLARRQRIVRAALKALAGSDYEQVKISDVARDSGVALGTLYRYFASKEHLFAAVFVEWQGALKKRLEREQPQGETEAERLRDVFHRTIRAFQLQPQFYRVLMMLTGTADAYAADLYQSLAAQSRDTVAMAFGGPFNADRAAILATVNAVLDESLRSWVMNRKAIADVYADVDNTIRLIYQYCPERG